MKHPSQLLLILAALAIAAPAVAQQGRQAVQLPRPAAIQRLPLRPHPRLFATAERFAEIRREVQSDPVMRHWYGILKARADTFVADRNLPVHEIRDGLRLLRVSRAVLERVNTLAIVGKISGDPRYRERAWEELRTVAAFPDWNPRHFLDVGEMTTAVAIGYDWFYDEWSEEQRELLEEAIAKHGLTPALEAYAGTVRGKDWPNAEDNWTQVTNGGAAIGALAILDERPDIASRVVHGAALRIPRSMRHYAPDGAWNEGPGYWHYGTLFATLVIDALGTALGTDFGLSTIPGFDRAGWFAIYMTSPAGPSFAFADVDRTIGPTNGSELLWLARHFDQPAYATHQLRYGRDLDENRASVFNLIWYDATRANARVAPPPLDRYFRGTEVVTLRSAWNDSNAVFVGLKAGDNFARHSNLDLGSFILDALGVRWATELGSDNYNMPGYFSYTVEGKPDGPRWRYYRMRAEGQNTLVLNPDTMADQDPRASARVVSFSSKPLQAFAVTDLTAAYAPDGARDIRRGISLLEGRRQVLVQDEIRVAKPAQVWWSMHTEAAVQLEGDGSSALLIRDGKRLWAKVLSPAGATFSVLPARALPGTANPRGQAVNEGIRKLAVRLDGVTRTRLAVLLVPLPAGEVPPRQLPTVRSISEW